MNSTFLKTHVYSQLITKVYKNLNIKKFDSRWNIFDRGICSEFFKGFVLKIVLTSLLEHVNAPVLTTLLIYLALTISQVLEEKRHQLSKYNTMSSGIAW